ncbi:MAG: allantoinase AllB [Alphaproteobacteria bacterium]|nr:allantoinase AllB [Alphaproteobacteria bacterium]
MATAFDLLITGGKVVTADSVMEADIGIADGIIIAVGRDFAAQGATEIISATGMHVLPGAIDSHVHFREPGYTHKENWGTGTAAAAVGGVTTVFEMPNTDPPTGTVGALRIKQEAAARQAYVDYGIYGLLDENNIDQLEALIAHGVAGFKCFMGNTFGNLPAPSDGAMLEGFEILAKHGARCVVHAENPSIMARRQARMEAAGRSDAHAHLAARPEVCEIEAIGRAVVFAEWTGARLHIAHHSSQDSLYVVRAAKARGVDVTVETCPQYLLLDSHDVERLGGILRVNPPIRAPGHGEALWQALLDGTIDMIATDHAPHAPEEKQRASIWTCDCGFPGVETQMSIMLTEINRGRATISDYVRWSAVNPAKAWGLFPRKGVIQPGADADIAIVDLAAEGTIDQRALHSRSKITPWHGRPTRGRPRDTIVRGRVVVRDGVLIGEPGWGRPVRQAMREPAPHNTDKTMGAITAPR